MVASAVTTPPVCPRCAAPQRPEGRFCQRCGARLGEGVGDPLLGEVLLGRYRVTRVLGEGTMGRVYLGEQRVGESVRNVAIKALAASRGNDDYIVARFRDDGGLTRAPQHHPPV
jgi:serine/threonine-protein kinase